MKKKNMMMAARKCKLKVEEFRKLYIAISKPEDYGTVRIIIKPCPQCGHEYEQ